MYLLHNNASAAAVGLPESLARPVFQHIESATSVYNCSLASCTATGADRLQDTFPVGAAVFLARFLTSSVAEQLTKGRRAAAAVLVFW